VSERNPLIQAIDLIREVCGGSEELFDLIVREVLS